MGQDRDLGKGKYHVNRVLKAEKLSEKLTRQGECISSWGRSCDVIWEVQATLSYSPSLRHRKFYSWGREEERGKRLEWED